MSDETKFPESFGYKNWTLQTSKVNDWIKRCKADFPDKTLYDENGRKIYSTSLIDWWKEKWFSQFKEKS